MSYKRVSPQPIVEGGTGAQTLTIHGVLLGNTTSAITATTAGTNGQILIGGTSAAPAFATMTSSASTLTYTPGSNTLNIDIHAPVAIAYGGTNATTMATTDGVVYFDGTSLVTTAVGTATQVLTSNGTGVAPTFQDAGGGSSDTIAITTVDFGVTPYTVQSGDIYLQCDVSGGVLTLLFPDTPVTGRIYYIKDATGSAATNNITLTTVSGTDTIDSYTSFPMNTNYQAVSLIFDGVGYEIY